MVADASIYAQLGKGVTPIANPQDQFLKTLQAYGAFAQMQRLGMDLQGRRALAQAYQGVTIDPKTGIPDSSQLIQNLQNTPGGALVLPQVIEGLQGQQKRLYDLNKQSQEQTTARTNAVNSAFNPLLRMGLNVRDSDIFSTFAGLHASGFSTDEAINDAAATLPARQPGQSDQQYGANLQNWILNHASRSWGADTQATQFKPNIATVDNGGQILTRDTNAYTSPGITSAAPIGKTFTPGEQASQVKGPLGPNGQPTVIPQGAYAQGAGMGNLVPGGGGSQPSPFANGGRLPSALMNPNRPGGVQPASAPGYAQPQPGVGLPSGYAPMAPSTGGDPMQPGLPGGYAPLTGGYGSPTPVTTQQSAPQMPALAAPMATGLGPAQQAGATAAGEASAKAWASQQQLASGTGGRLYQLQTALGALQREGQTGTGPSSGTLNTMRSYLQSLPVVGQNLGIDPNSVADYDIANKYLTAYASARASARGGTTDSQLATTLSSNASTHISNLAAQDVVRANMGLERMDAANIAGFQNGVDPATGQATGQKMTPDQYSDYSAAFSRNMDPRAFIAPELSQQQFASTVAGMQPGEQAKFRNTFNAAISQGWIDPPEWMSGQGAAAPAAAGGIASPSPTAPPAPAPDLSQQASAGPATTMTGNGQSAVRGY